VKTVLELGFTHGAASMRSENPLGIGCFPVTAQASGHGSVLNQAKLAVMAPHASPSCKRSQHVGDPNKRHDSSEVVCQGRQAELGSYLLQALHEEIALVMPVLDGTERMLHDLFAPFHDRGVRLDPLLHPFQDVLVHPAGNAAARLVPCAARLDRTGPTSGGRLVANLPPQLDGRKAEGQRLSGGASVTVLLRIIGELLFPLEP
jgi:hypothetical protein